MSICAKKIVLVDGSSYLYRAFHALPALTNSKGQPTGAIYGILNMLRKLKNDYQPTHMAVIFDTKSKTFREDLYPQYKAHRETMPDELVSQLVPIHSAIKALGIPLITVDGVEADDVIGTFAKQATENQQEVLISTGDKDFAQLVNRHITLINTMTNTVYDEIKVKEKFGVTPAQIIDYLSLIGDTSDNIPGIPMVGPKTAAKWLGIYGTIENLIEHQADIKGKVGDNFRQFIPELALNRQLVTIKTDVELNLNLADLTLQPEDKNFLLNFYREMEFKTWLSDLITANQAINPTNKTFTLVNDEKIFKDLLNFLMQSSQFVFDVKTTTPHQMSAKLVGFSFSIQNEQSYYIPIGHDYVNAPAQLNADLVITALKPILENPHIAKISYDTKFIWQVLKNYDIELRGKFDDVMLQAYLLDSTSNNQQIDSLALKYLGNKVSSYNDIAGKGVKQQNFNDINISKAAEYCAEIVETISALNKQLNPKITIEAGLSSVYQTIEIPLITILASMEKTGILIDPNLLKKHGSELQARLEIIEKNAYELAGKSFNINSPKQLQEILFDVLMLPVLQKTPTGQPSTADPVLQELAQDFPLPKLIIEYRSLSKLISTYTSRLVTEINSNTQRIHTSYHQTGTATGRLSSSDPNLQNIPIRNDEGRKIRQAFIAPAGKKLISADYSQIELRLMAHISQDPGLLYAFQNNLDVHQATAAEVWEVELESVTSNMRRDAKAINFGLIYGMSAFGLTKQLGIDRKEAEAYINRYFARYPKVKQYMENTRDHAKQTGYVETLWGRRLYLPDINSRQVMRQKAAERVAINAPLQGSAADIIKKAMISVHNWLINEKNSVKMLLQVHDELVFEVDIDEANTMAEKIRQKMESVVELSIPLVVSVGIGDNWDSAAAH